MHINDVKAGQRVILRGVILNDNIDEDGSIFIETYDWAGYIDYTNVDLEQPKSRLYKKNDIVRLVNWGRGTKHVNDTEYFYVIEDEKHNGFVKIANLNNTIAKLVQYYDIELIKVAE